MSNSYYRPAQPDEAEEKPGTILRARSGPVRMRKSGAGFHASTTNRQRQRGQAAKAAIRRSMDGER